MWAYCSSKVSLRDSHRALASLSRVPVRASSMSLLFACLASAGNAQAPTDSMDHRATASSSLSCNSVGAELSGPLIGRLIDSLAPVLHFAPLEDFFPTLPMASRLPALARAIFSGRVDSARFYANLPWTVGYKSERPRQGPFRFVFDHSAPMTEMVRGWSWKDETTAYRDRLVHPNHNQQTVTALEAEIKATKDAIAHLSDGPLSPDVFRRQQDLERNWRSLLAMEDSLRDVVSLQSAKQLIDSALQTLADHDSSDQSKHTTITTRTSIIPALRARRDTLAAAYLLQSIVTMSQLDSLAVRNGPGISSTHKLLTERKRTLEAARDSLRAINLMQRVPPKSDAYLLTQACGFAPSSAATFWRVISHDKQLVWRRELRESIELATNDSLVLVTFWMFYLADRGLEGHAFDRERLTIAMPATTARWIADHSQPAGKPLMVMAGAAHSTTDPNNILVLSGRAETRLRPHAVVELGGHATSPDRRPTREITLGWDINYRAAERGWGLRDIQAINGSGFSGAFTSEEQLPRSDETSTDLFPTTDMRRSSGAATYRLLRMSSVHMIFRLLRRWHNPTNCGENGARSFPAADALIQLMLAAFPEEGHRLTSEQVGQAVTKMLGYSPIRHTEARLVTARTAAAMAAGRIMVCQWREEALGGLAPADSLRVHELRNVMPWKHPDITSPPEAVLKNWVYPPVTSEVSRKLGWFVTAPQPYRHHMVFLMPLGGPILTFPGALEAHLGFASSGFMWGTQRLSGRLQWNSSFNEVIGLNIIAFDYTHRRHASADLRGQQDVAVGAGATLWIGNALNKVWPKSWPALRKLELRAAIMGSSHRFELGLNYRFQN